MLTILLLSVASLSAPQPAADPGAPVAFPHPLITEVLFNVPPRSDGDADGDGFRSATGDEFVELINPHDRPISLKGYVLTDAKRPPPPDAPGLIPPRKNRVPGSVPPTRERPPADKPDGQPEETPQLRYEFGDVTLAPGQVVVVFNGFRGDGPRPAPPPTLPSAPSKDPKAPPAAIRLSMNATSEYAAFGNGGDHVLLSDPSGTGVHRIAWGEHVEKTDTPATLTENVPEMHTRGSVTRAGLTKGLVTHNQQAGAMKGRLFSPGEFPVGTGK